MARVIRSAAPTTRNLVSKVGSQPSAPVCERSDRPPRACAESRGGLGRGGLARQPRGLRRSVENCGGRRSLSPRALQTDSPGERGSASGRPVRTPPAGRRRWDLAARIGLSRAEPFVPEPPAPPWTLPGGLHQAPTRALAGSSRHGGAEPGSTPRPRLVPVCGSDGPGSRERGRDSSWVFALLPAPELTPTKTPRVSPSWCEQTSHRRPAGTGGPALGMGGPCFTRVREPRRESAAGAPPSPRSAQHRHFPQTRSPGSGELKIDAGAQAEQRKWALQSPYLPVPDYSRRAQCRRPRTYPRRRLGPEPLCLSRRQKGQRLPKACRPRASGDSSAFPLKQAPDGCLLLLLF